MAETIKGLNVVIGAETSGLSAALKDVNKKSKGIADELRQVDRLLKFNPKDTELLAQKQKLLGDQVAATREKLDRLKNAQEQINEQFAKGDITEGQYRAFQREIVETESKLNHYKNKLSEVSQANDQLAQKTAAASESLKKFGVEADKAGKSLTTKVTAPIAAAGAVAFKMAADMEDAMGATEETFNSASGAMREWADNLESYYGIANTEALEYGNMMGSMLQNIGGLTEEQAANQAQTLIELAGDLTAMYGGTTQDAVKALTGALKGNNSMLDNYGMAVNDAMIKTKAYEMGLYSGTGQMDLATKQAVTLALVMEQSTAAQGQASREAEGASGSLRALGVELKNLSVSLGEVLLPIITPLISSLGKLVNSIRSLDPATKQIIVVVAGVAAALGPVLLIVGKLAGAISAILAILPQVKIAMVAVNAVMAANPIGVVIVAVAALVAAGVALYKNWDIVKETMLNIWDSLVYGVEQAVSYLKTLVLSYAKMWVDTADMVGKYIPGVNSALDGLQNKLQEMINTEKDSIKYRRESRKETKAQTAATKEAAAATNAANEAEKKLNQTKKESTEISKERAEFEKEWNDKLFKATASRIEILEAEKAEQLRIADELGANKANIEKYYNDQIEAVKTEAQTKDLELAKQWNLKRQQLEQQQKLANVANVKEEYDLKYQMLMDAQERDLEGLEEGSAARLEVLAYYKAEEEKLLGEKQNAYAVASASMTDSYMKFVSAMAAGKDSAKETLKQMATQFISTMQAQITAAALSAEAIAKAMALSTFGASLSHLAVIAGEVLPKIAALEALKAGISALAEGGKVTAPTLALIGEGKDNEAVIPLNKNVFAELGRNIAANMPQAATAGTNMTINLNVGYMIGDEKSIKKLAQKVFSYEYSVKQRIGG